MRQTLTRILEFRHADLEVFQRDALAVEHPVDVVVGLDEKLCGIGEWLVAGKPSLPAYGRAG